MGFGQGFEDARKSIAIVFAILSTILITGAVVNVLYSVLVSTKTPIGEYLVASFQATVRATLELLIAVFSLVGTFGIIETLSRSMNDPEWGLGYAIGLAIISSMAILVVTVLLSAPYVPQLKGISNLVDPSSDIIVAATGAAAGFALHIAKRLIQSELEDTYY